MSTHRPSRSVVLSIAAALILAALVWGALALRQTSEPNAASNQTAPVTVRYAAFRGVSGLAGRLGDSKGFYAAEGLRIEFIETEDPIAALAAGDADIADWNSSGAIVAAGKGAPIKIVSSFFRTRLAYYLVAAPNVSDIASLRGKTVGLAFFGSNFDVATRTILRRNGVPDAAVDYVGNGVDQTALASLRERHVDASILHEPSASIAESQGFGHILAAARDYLPDYHGGVLVASDRFIRENPRALSGFLRAYFQANAYFKSHPAEYEDVYVAQLHVSRDIARKAIARDRPIWDNTPGVDLARLNKTQQTRVAMGLQDRVYEPAKLLDLRFLPAPTAVATPGAPK